MHKAIETALAKSEEPLSLTIVGGKKDATVLLAFSTRHPFPVWAAKVGAGSESTDRLRREKLALELLAPFAMSLGVPRALDWEEGAHSACLRLSGVDGFSVHFGLQDTRVLYESLAWLKRFRSTVPSATIEKRLGAVDDLEWLRGESAHASAFGRLADRLGRTANFPQVASHGDYWCGNILFDRGRMGVIDLEGLSSRHALHDVFSLLTHCSYRASGKIELDLGVERFLELYFGESSDARFVKKLTEDLSPAPAELSGAFYAFVTSSLRLKGGRYRDTWLEILADLDRRGFPEPWRL